MKIELSKIVVTVQSKASPLFAIKKFVIPAGASVLIRGASGRGKTTLLHLIAGLFVPESGHVRVGEQRLDSLSENERCRFRRHHVGLVFQKLNLLEHLTARENVLLGLPAHSDAKVDAALRSLQLHDQALQRSSTLSLGEQQRVAVARVLAAEPQLILADEPTSSLDEGNARLVMDALFSAAGGRTFVVVSHDHRLQQRFDQVLDFEKLVDA